MVVELRQEVVPTGTSGVLEVTEATGTSGVLEEAG
jgi:hypothetical protein